MGNETELFEGIHKKIALIGIELNFEDKSGELTSRIIDAYKKDLIRDKNKTVFWNKFNEASPIKLNEEEINALIRDNGAESYILFNLDNYVKNPKAGPILHAFIMDYHAYVKGFKDAKEIYGK